MMARRAGRGRHRPRREAVGARARDRERIQAARKERCASSMFRVAPGYDTDISGSGTSQKR